MDLNTDNREQMPNIGIALNLHCILIPNIGIALIVAKVNLGTIKRLRRRGSFTVLLPYNTCAGLIFPKKEAAAL